MSFARYTAFALTFVVGTFWHVRAFAADDGIPVDMLGPYERVGHPPVHLADW